MNMHCAEGQECMCYDECALVRLRRSAPDIATHVETMVGQYGLKEVMAALDKQRTHYDSYDFGVMASLAGGAVLRQHENGEEQEAEALTRIAECHGIM